MNRTQSEPGVGAGVPGLIRQRGLVFVCVHRWFQLFSLGALALIVVLVTRAVFIEAFGVPTGSMAPQIVGIHRAAACPNCGITVRVGDAGAIDARFYDVACPNCGFRGIGLDRMPPAPGDRMLVDKSAWEFRAPGRWELAVFKNPNELSQPFVKRIAGLPDETVSIHDGDVYANGQIARKSLRLAQAVAVPVVNLAHRPSEGWGEFWHSDAPESAESGPRAAGAELILPCFRDGRWRGLAYRRPRGAPISDRLSYNGRRSDLAADWVHDFVVACEITATEGDGEMTITLTDSADEATVTLSPSAGARMTAGIDSQAIADGRLRLHAVHRLAFAFVDRRAVATLDGTVIGEPIDLPPRDDRTAVERPLRIQSRNLGLVVRNLTLGRDLHYAPAGRLGSGQCRLGPNEYFMLGDNSGNSEDSRFWPQPGVPRRMLIGRPMFVYAATNWESRTFFGRSWRADALRDGRFGWLR